MEKVNCWMGLMKWETHGEFTNLVGMLDTTFTHDSHLCTLSFSCDKSYLAEDTTVECRTQHNVNNYHMCCKTTTKPWFDSCFEGLLYVKRWKFQHSTKQRSFSNDAPTLSQPSTKGIAEPTEALRQPSTPGSRMPRSWLWTTSDGRRTEELPKTNESKGILTTNESEGRRPARWIGFLGRPKKLHSNLKRAYCTMEGVLLLLLFSLLFVEMGRRWSKNCAS